MKYVSFPDLGIGPIRLDPVAFTLFGIDVMWYGLIITCGMLLAYLYGLSRAKIEKVKADDVTDLTLFLIVFGVVGARLYYILFKLEDFVVGDAGGVWENFLATAKNMLNFRGGGLAIYGGIIAGFVTAFVVARVKHIRFPVILDIVAPCLMIGQMIGRWGNFVNVEAYGSITELPWKMGIGTNGGMPFVHPTFLYESLWSLVGLILVSIFYKKKKFHGQVFVFYGLWYGLGRAWIEGLRTDSLMLGPLRVSQILSIVIFVACAVIMAVGLAKAPRVVGLAYGNGAAREAHDTKGSDVLAASTKADSTDDETLPDEANDGESTLFAAGDAPGGDEVNDSEEENENGKDN